MRLANAGSPGKLPLNQVLHLLLSSSFIIEIVYLWNNFQEKAVSANTLQKSLEKFHQPVKCDPVKWMRNLTSDNWLLNRSCTAVILSERKFCCELMSFCVIHILQEKCHNRCL